MAKAQSYFPLFSMKHNIYAIFLAALLPIVAFGQKTIHVAKAGMLNTLISDEEKYTITRLTLTGELDGTDLRLLRDMAGNNYEGQLTSGQLNTLDLSGVTIVEGGANYLDCNEIFLDASAKMTDSRGFVFASKANAIPQWLFVGCNSLKHVVLPATITSVDDYAFAECMLESINLPVTVRTIGERAFYHNTKLTVFDMPQAVETIGPNAFSYCSGLTQITLPATLREIGKNAFNKCNHITKVYSCLSSPCDITTNTFTVYDKATLYVPVGCRAAYAATAPWNKFSAIEEFTTTMMKNVRNRTDDSRGEVYDLQGRKVLQPSKGIRIVNGRKVAPSGNE